MVKRAYGSRMKIRKVELRTPGMVDSKTADSSRIVAEDTGVQLVCDTRQRSIHLL